MRYVILLLILSNVLLAQKNNPCCAPTATEEFAAFGKDMAFVTLHDAPEPFVFQAAGGSMRTIKTSDGTDTQIFEVKSSSTTNKYVFVFHEWWGLNDYIKQEAEQLQRDLGEVNVIALDLYDGKVAMSQDSARKYVGAVDDDRARIIIRAVMDYAGETASVATLGWCFGGGWSMQAALMLGKQAAGCVIYYGMPEKEVVKLKTLNCSVLGIFGTQDGYINPQVVSEFEKAMKAAGKKLTVKNYDAVHAFANPSNPKYDKEKSALANAEARLFLKTVLK
ncbi:MAG: dienelactone hydrolase family protein [Bacteroidota bacterium]|jgi:carboxymethylenebutenolidase